MVDFINFSRAFDKTNNLVGFDVITEGNSYIVEDMYGNTTYVAKTSKQSEVMALFTSPVIQDWHDIDEIKVGIRKYFKRK